MAEEAEAGREAVDEVVPSDRTDLSVAEKSGDGNRSYGCLNCPDVVMGLSIEIFSPAQTTEEKPTGRRGFNEGFRLFFQQMLEIFPGGVGVPDLELHRLSDGDPVADGNRSRIRINADEIPDEEIASAKFFFLLIHNYP